MREAHKSSAPGFLFARANGGITKVFLTGVLFLGGLPGLCHAGPYPIPGPDDDPNHCSGRKDQPVFYCVTPPPDSAGGVHCEEIMAESSPLYLGYRYECVPAKDTAPGNR